jgi:hypothetical protein
MENAMADKKQCDQYASELARRFEELTHWAVDNWPLRDTPLLLSDFETSRKEFGAIIGPRLSQGRGDPASSDEAPQYVQVNPAPWP